MSRRRRRGQVATEYMLAISVIVLTAVLAGYELQEPLRSGWQSFSSKFETYFAKPGGPGPA